MRLDGKALAARIRDQVRHAVDQLPHQPHLHAILVGDDPASRTYVGMKARDCKEVGIASTTHELPADTTQAALLDLLEQLNADPDCDGILVQLPLPDHMDENTVLEAVDPAKDADGFHPINLGRLVAGEPGLVPATPQGCIALAREALPDLTGKHIVIVGRSTIVGKPVGLLGLLKGIDATVTTAHSRTADLKAVTRQADVLIVAAGVPHLIGPDHVHEDAVVIDVGTTRVEDPDGGKARLTGDVDTDAVEPHVRAISPVPGGVGPLTRAYLLVNTVQAAIARRGGDVEVDLPTVP